MYKINYKGYSVEVNSVEALNKLVNTKSRKSSVSRKIDNKTFSAKSPVVVVASSKKARRSGTTAKRWLTEEVQYIANNIDKMSFRAMLKSKYLLKRHSPGGITMMYWKVDRNPQQMKLTPACQAVVDQFQSRRMSEILNNN